ncbi:signal recognition particle-docking protein FtsY [Entomohabitans teleogrylli]|uniref:signal recognition particle-docking protein FtsY n=1 Tax=Entomohabitans teleogrylli TaxID=1384589 RepID=UPI00073D5ED3|nr:signal recognition particle-docking protein FtsY [Entomohabitans teleogrylli]
MAKEKKKGFFSWLGFGQKEQTPEAEKEQPIAEQQPAVDAPEQGHSAGQAPAEPVETHSGAEAEVFAREVVQVNEQLAESGKPVVEPARAAESDERPDVTVPSPQGEPAAVAQPEIAHVSESELATHADVEPATPTLPDAEVQPAFQGVNRADAPVVDDSPHQPVTADTPERPAAQPEPSLAGAEPVEPPRDEWQEQQDLIVEEEVAIAEAELASEAALGEPEAEHEAQPETLEPQEQEKPTKEGFFTRLKRSLVKTRQNLGSGFISLFRGKKIDDDLFDELEEQLLIADVGVETTRKIINNLTEGASRKQLRDAEALYTLLKEEMSGILAKVDEPLNVEGKMPFVILMVGVNGVGKTTTIGKMARQFQQQGKSVMLAAGDTFRAAAVEQLQVWGQRNNIPVVAQHTGADSASVIFDAIQAAKARHVDVLIADTAGRLQNKAHLMEELKKIVRVMKKLDEQAPHEVMLTLDASTGQNAVSQAKLFHEAVGLTGITLTKLDGTAKGGVIFSIADQFAIPIRYIGVGERIEDLRPFNAGDFIEALFARED